MRAALDRIVAAAALVVLTAAAAAAQVPKVELPGECTTCHDHKDQVTWANTRDGDGKGKRHKFAYRQLIDPMFQDKVSKFVAAAGVASAKDTYCLNCHATIVDGRPKDGITCQSCHGPGSLYLKPHQKAGWYKESTNKLGMKAVVNSPTTWIQECVTCHVMGNTPDKDKAIVAADHPSGSDFIVGNKLTFVQGPGHWKSNYTASQINAEGEPLRRSLLARLDTVPAPARPPAAGPARVEDPSPAATGPTAGRADPVARPVPPESAPDPPRSTPPVPDVAATLPGTPPAAIPPSAKGSVVPPSPPPTPREIAAGPAPPPRPSPVVRTTRTPAPKPPAPEPPAAVMAPAAVVGSIQGRLAALLDVLLVRGVTLPKPVTPAVQRTIYRGADADLLRLQDEVIALALEALATPPPKETAKP
jgi:hypothetical protein